MMQLATIASFVVLLCGLFGTTMTANNDQNTMTGYDVARSIRDLSSSCIFGVKSVSAVLFTSDKPNGTNVQVNESCNLLDPSKPVFFMTHGFIASAYNYKFSDLASLLLKNGYTVFSLDWDDASCYNDPAIVNLLEYFFAADNTHEVSDYLASFVKTVIEDCHVPLKNITLMGHSLGAHISGFAAKKLKNSNYTIPLLIGTDPAAPGFILPCEKRFCKTDAKRVIAFHTSALGLQQSLGHCDFWFNNGLCQSACGVILIDCVNVNCSHNIVIVYLITILDGYEYVGVSISERIVSLPRIPLGCSLYGSNYTDVNKKIFDSNSNITGDYCVSVTSMYPYCTKADSNCQ